MSLLLKTTFAVAWLLTFATAAPRDANADKLPAGAQVGECHRQFTTTSNRDVKLSGRLIKRMAWGPPNFGEDPKTDSRYAIWIVRLDYSISVVVGEEIGVSPERIRAREIQIRRGSATDKLVPGLSGKHVVVQGQLSTQVFSGDNTPVVMDASAIRTGGQVSCGD